jgi:hypothetical protein
MAKTSCVGYTYVVIVFSTKLSKLTSTKTLIDGKTTHQHNLHANLCSQMDSIVFRNKNPLPFLKTYFVVEKKLNNTYGNTCAFFLMGS